VKPSPALLDVSLLVALFDPTHIHHDVAHDWFEDRHHYGWATCPLTENGFVRVMSNPAYGSEMRRPDVVIKALRKFRQSAHHRFWDANLSLSNDRLFRLEVIRGHGQLTDVYLLGLATTMKGCLATFDRTIPVSAVRGARKEHLQVIAPVEDEPGPETVPAGR
jgi:hypothetical protein